MISMGEAIQSLRPGTEFVMTGDDVENITWHTLNVAPLTRAEVDAEIARLEQAAEAAAAAKDAALVSAREKLAVLGLDEAEVSALLGGL